MRKPGLSRAQQGQFRPLVNKAWFRHCVLWNLETKAANSRRDWYEQQLFQALKIHSTTERIISPDDFHDLLLHFATLAQHTEWLKRLATEQERRLRYLIRLRLGEIADLTGEKCTWAYACATFTQMDYQIELDEAPAEYMRTALQALDTYVRRLLRRLGMTRREWQHALKRRPALQHAIAETAHTPAHMTEQVRSTGQEELMLACR